MSDLDLSRLAPRELEGRELEGRELEGTVMKTPVVLLAERVLKSLEDLLPAIAANEHLTNAPRDLEGLALRARQEVNPRGTEGLAPRARQGLAPRARRGLAPRVLEGNERRVAEVMAFVEMERAEILLVLVTEAHPEVVVPRHLAVVDVHVSHEMAHRQPIPFVSFASSVVKIDCLRRL